VCARSGPPGTSRGHFLFRGATGPATRKWVRSGRSPERQEDRSDDIRPVPGAASGATGSDGAELPCAVAGGPAVADIDPEAAASGQDAPSSDLRHFRLVSANGPPSWALPKTFRLWAAENQAASARPFLPAVPGPAWVVRSRERADSGVAPRRRLFRWSSPAGSRGWQHCAWPRRECGRHEQDRPGADIRPDQAEAAQRSQKRLSRRSKSVQGT
jgi:hypothetical protein